MYSNTGFESQSHMIFFMLQNSIFTSHSQASSLYDDIIIKQKKNTGTIKSNLYDVMYI